MEYHVKIKTRVHKDSRISDLLFKKLSKPRVLYTKSQTPIAPLFEIHDTVMVCTVRDNYSVKVGDSDLLNLFCTTVTEESLFTFPQTHILKTHQKYYYH